MLIDINKVLNLNFDRDISDLLNQVEYTEKVEAIFSKSSISQTVNTDHPDCPECNSKMMFYIQNLTGEFSYGDGYLECSCGFKFYEQDLAEAFKTYSKKKI